MIELLKNLAHFFVSPLNVLWVFLLIAWSLRLMSIQSKMAKLLPMIGFIWLFWCSLPYGSAKLVQPLEYKYPTIDHTDLSWRKSDGILVMGCYHFEESHLPFSGKWATCSTERNLQALVMYREHPLPIYLTGGILADNKLTESEANAEFFRTLGVPDSDIHIIREGQDTQSGALAIGNRMKGKTLALVTSARHQWRAGKYLQDQGIQVIHIPVDHLTKPDIEPGWPDAYHLEVSEDAIYEWLGLAYQALLY